MNDFKSNDSLGMVHWMMVFGPLLLVETGLDEDDVNSV